MKEQPSNHEQDSYWTHDQEIGEVRLWDNMRRRLADFTHTASTGAASTPSHFQ